MPLVISRTIGCTAFSLVPLVLEHSQTKMLQAVITFCPMSGFLSQCEHFDKMVEYNQKRTIEYQDSPLRGIEGGRSHSSKVPRSKGPKVPWFRGPKVLGFQDPQVHRSFEGHI